MEKNNFEESKELFYSVRYSDFVKTSIKWGFALRYIEELENKIKKGE